MAYTYKRVLTIALDSIGIGEAPDAARFDDVGADTLGHIGEFFDGGLHLPNLARIGLGNIRDIDPAVPPIKGVPAADPAGNRRRHEELRRAGLPAQDLADLIRTLSEQMHTAAEQLQFELAARLRDEIRDLKKELRAMTEAKK